MNSDRSRFSLTERDNVFERKNERFNISLDLDGDYSLTEYTLDKDTSALHNWVNMGAMKYLTREETELLKNKSQPKKEKSRVSAFDIELTLEPHEVRMYILEK